MCSAGMDWGFDIRDLPSGFQGPLPSGRARSGIADGKLFFRIAAEEIPVLIWANADELHSIYRLAGINSVRVHKNDGLELSINLERTGICRAQMIAAVMAVCEYIERKSSELPEVQFSRADFEKELQGLISIHGVVGNGRLRLEYGPAKVTLRFETEHEKATPEERRLADQAEILGLTLTVEDDFPASYLSITAHFSAQESESVAFRKILSFLRSEDPI